MTTERREKVDRVLNRRQPDLSVLMERIRKPHNFSAVLRTCDAVGVAEAHAIGDAKTLPVISHTAQGAENWVEVVRHETSADAARQLRQSGFNLVVTRISSKSVDYRNYDFTRPSVLALGTEYSGVSDELVALSDAQIMIPMQGMTQSLNVSVACAIILYEAQRQRELAGFYAERRLPDDIWRTRRFEWLHPKVAAFCRDKGLDYPALNEAGDIIENLSRRG